MVGKNNKNYPWNGGENCWCTKEKVRKTSPTKQTQDCGGSFRSQPPHKKRSVGFWNLLNGVYIYILYIYIIYIYILYIYIYKTQHVGDSRLNFLEVPLLRCESPLPKTVTTRIMKHMFRFWDHGCSLYFPLKTLREVIFQHSKVYLLRSNTSWHPLWPFIDDPPKLAEVINKWWFQIFFKDIFTPIWGRFPIWLIFVQMGWNHQPGICLPVLVLKSFWLGGDWDWKKPYHIPNHLSLPTLT